MATINVGGRTVEVPDDLDPTKPATLRQAGPSATRPAQPAPAPAINNPRFASGVSPEAQAWRDETNNVNSTRVG